MGSRRVEGITCYLSGDYAGSASNGGKTEAGSSAQVLLSREESAEQTATSAPAFNPLVSLLNTSNCNSCLYKSLVSSLNTNKPAFPQGAPGMNLEWSRDKLFECI